MIRIKGLSKRFGDFTAVDNLSFDVEPGDIVGFLGPNGAGKSTTMKMITGFLEPTEGSVEINGFAIDQNPLAVKQSIGYLPEGAPAYGDMTPAQFLSFIADVRGLSGENKKQRIREVIDAVELKSVLQRPIDNLSKGFKRRVGLAQAILHDPKVLILDEPTDGLDPNQKHQVRRLIQNLSKDKIVVISTHILEEVTAVCNRAMIIANGKKLFDDTPQALEAQSKHHNAITIQFAGEKPNIDILEGDERVAECIYGEACSSVTVVPSDNSQNLFTYIFELAQQQSWSVKSIYAERGRLDDVFRTMTTEGK